MATIGRLAYQVVADVQQFAQGMVLTRSELREARRAFVETRTPAEQYGLAIDALARQHQRGVIDADVYRRRLSQVRSEFSASAQKSTILTDALRNTSLGSRFLAVAMNPVTLAIAAVTAGAAAGAFALKKITEATYELAAASIKASANHEQLTIAFEVMLQSAEKGQKVLGQIEDFAKATPFQFNEVAEAGRKLLGFGVAGDQVVPTLRMLGDLAAGVQKPIGDLASIYGKTQQKGKLMAEELNQFAENSIPIVGKLAQQFGVTDQEVRKLAEQGKISFGHLQRALMELTAEGGLFGGMMERQSQTLLGAWSNLQDEGDAILRGIGKSLQDNLDLTSIVQDAAAGAQDLQSIMSEATGFIVRDLRSIAENVTGLELNMNNLGLTVATMLAPFLEGLHALRLGILEVKAASGDVNAAVELAFASTQVGPSEAIFGAIFKDRAEAAKKAAVDPLALSALPTDNTAAAKAAKDAKKLQADIARDAKKAFDETRTPQEKFNSEFADLTKLLSVGAISWETYGRAVAKAKDELAAAREKMYGTAEAQKKVEQVKQVAAIVAQPPRAGTNRALEAGTADAFSEVLRHQRGGADPLKAMEKHAAKSADLLAKIDENTRREAFEIKVVNIS
jgi:tape measure domain-containing protein